MRALLQSFADAGRGAVWLLRSQRNAHIHAAATAGVIALAAWLRLSRLEWCALVAAIGLVWLAEALNTALEQLGDAVSQQSNPLVGRAKDVAAGGVLLAALAAAAIGLVVLGPPLLARLTG